MIYLNDAFEGGETKFNKCSIEPATGKALIFRHELLHEGCPVITGIKYVLRTDIMYRRK
jgi:prolyl 4-hydroxylase